MQFSVSIANPIHEIEEQMLAEIRKLEDRVYGHDFEIERQTGLAPWMRYPEELVARCKNCEQLVLIRKKSAFKPILFGRRSWKPFELQGLPTIWYCSYLQRQLLAFPPNSFGPYRGT